MAWKARLTIKSWRRQPSRDRTGRRAEALCRWVLRFKGYRIIASRYRSRLGEIDIVAARGKVLALVEVKARPSLAEGAAAINPQQQRRLGHAAQDFLARHPDFNQYVTRFDVMLVSPRHWPLHIPDAWGAASR